MASCEGTLEEFLDNNNLGKYYEKFKEQGAFDIQDVLTGVDKDVLTQDIGMSNLEANKFMKIITRLNGVSFTFLFTYM